MTTRDALLFSDGSLTVFAAGRPIHLIRNERQDSDRNAPPHEWTKIVRVRFAVAEILEDPGAVTTVPLSEVEQLRAEVARLRAKCGEST
jgi:hypothetical protein